MVYLGNTLADLQISAASFLDELAALKDVETQMATLCSTPFAASAAAAAAATPPSALHCLIVHIEIAIHWLVGSVGMRVIDVRRYHALQRHSLLRHAAVARSRGDAAALASATDVLGRFEATYASLRMPTTHVAHSQSYVHGADGVGFGGGGGASGLGGGGSRHNPHIEIASEIDPTELYQNAIAIAFAHASGSQETLLADQQHHQEQHHQHHHQPPHPPQEQPRGSLFDLSRIGAVAAHVGNLPRDSIISATLPIFISRAFEEVSSTSQSTDEMRRI